MKSDEFVGKTIDQYGYTDEELQHGVEVMREIIFGVVVILPFIILMVCCFGI